MTGSGRTSRGVFLLLYEFRVNLYFSCLPEEVVPYAIRQAQGHSARAVEGMGITTASEVIYFPA